MLSNIPVRAITQAVANVRQVRAMATSSSPPEAKKLPGFGLPINAKKDLISHRTDEHKKRFPDAISATPGRNYEARLLTVREYTMMELMNKITDKLDWDRKVFDAKIQSKWRTEVLRSGVDVSERMFDWVCLHLSNVVLLFYSAISVWVFSFSH